MYKPIIFFVAVIISLASSAKRNTDIQFQIELKELSEAMGQEFHDLNDVKVFFQDILRTIKIFSNNNELFDNIVLELEQLYEILEEAKWPNDLVQLRKFVGAFDDTGRNIFELIFKDPKDTMSALQEIMRVATGFLTVVAETCKGVTVV